MASIASRNVSESQSHESREGLTSWWSKFKSRPTKKEAEVARSSIFSIPLHESITYANVAISLYNDNGQTFIYGYIPIVVAKCGLFLKDNATETEGIFRLSGSAKRIKDLQAIFDQPPKYGKGLDWSGFTVHDAANILRRYLNHLPDPIIPYDWYDSFRQPLKEGWSMDKTIPRMQELVASLPALNRQLLLYILDLLAVFASKSDVNRMTSENLSAIFQPGLITHPRDDMAPQEYRLSQEVLVFLIDNQSHFLLDTLCSPTKDRAPSPPGSKKTSVMRRRTLQPVRRPPSQVQISPSDSASATPQPAEDARFDPSPISFSRKSSSAALSRSSTLPSKRNVPSRATGDFNTTGPGFRHVSTPVLGRGSNSNSPQPTIPEVSRTPIKRIVPELVDPQSNPMPQITANTTEIARHQAPGMSGDIEAPGQSSADQFAGQSKDIVDTKFNLSTYADNSGTAIDRGVGIVNKSNSDTRSDDRQSRKSSRASSFVNESEFSAISGRKLPAENTFQGQGSAARSMNTATASSSRLSPDKNQRARESKQMSSSPSKFTNLFKRKVRHQSISSPTEAGGRRDLDR